MINDIVFIAGIVIFFVIAILYVFVCDFLREEKHE